MDESPETEKVIWVFRVMPNDLNAADWFEFAIAVVNPTIGKVTMMNNRNMVQYRGKALQRKSL